MASQNFNRFYKHKGHDRRLLMNIIKHTRREKKNDSRIQLSNVFYSIRLLIWLNEFVQQMLNILLLFFCLLHAFVHFQQQQQKKKLSCVQEPVSLCAFMKSKPCHTLFVIRLYFQFHNFDYTFFPIIFFVLCFEGFFFCLHTQTSTHTHMSARISKTYAEYDHRSINILYIWRVILFNQKEKKNEKEYA